MQIVFLFYDRMTALDAVGPHEILSSLPGAEVKRVALRRGPVASDSGLILNADYALSEISSADLLLLPGSSTATSMQNSPEILDWVRAIHATTQWTTSVCTGSLILGAAGILSGLRATTHWAALERLRAWNAEPVAERIVEDGKVITAAGVSAGIDMALTLAAKIAGQPFAETMQLAIEYDPEPPFDVGSPAKANPEVLKALRARLDDLFEKVK